jgi:GNAT superfamily N-acetyltransferase
MAAASAGSGGGSPVIGRAYAPGALGRVVELHARFYARAAGFGTSFECRVAAELAAFVPVRDEPGNGLWLARDGERVVGSIAIDGRAGDGAAELRWFIVDEALRGGGVGRRLLERALAFCDRGGVATVGLWTFRGLDAARALYERAGFVLACERPGTRWGTEVVEQRFVRAAARA